MPTPTTLGITVRATSASRETAASIFIVLLGIVLSLNVACMPVDYGALQRIKVAGSGCHRPALQALIIAEFGFARLRIQRLLQLSCAGGRRRCGVSLRPGLAQGWCDLVGASSRAGQQVVNSIHRGKVCE